LASYRVLDIETVPDPSVWTQNSPTWRLATDASFISDERALYPAAVVQDVPFPPAQAHRVVAISWVDLSGDDNKWYFVESYESKCMFDVDGESEAETELLRLFADAQENDVATLVSWNGRTFDLPVLNLRSFHKGIAWPWYYQDRDVRYRYSETGHCDMMDVLSDYGACRQMKLGDAARLIGLPGKVGPVSGADVAALVESCRGATEKAISETQEKIARYCLSDSVQTAVLFLRHRFHRGMISTPHHDAAIKTFEKNFPDVFDGDFDWSKLLIGTEPSKGRK